MRAWALVDEDGESLLEIAAEGWMRRGACASGGQRLGDFFVEEKSDKTATEQIYAAKRFCAGCQVRPECLAWAMDIEAGEDYRSGTFGGLSPIERTMVNAADDPIALGLRILDEQVASGLVFTGVELWEEKRHASGTE